MFAFGTSIPALKRHENPGHSSALSLKDESSPSILSLAETTVGGLQGWKNLGSLRCNLHHVWAASVWLSKLWGVRSASVVTQSLPLSLQKMCSCGTARLWASSVFEIKILSLSSRLQQGFISKECEMSASQGSSSSTTAFRVKWFPAHQPERDPRAISASTQRHGKPLSWKH